MGVVSDPTRNMEYVFDYGNITDENKAAALEIANMLESIGLGELAQAIKVKFNIVEIPKYNLDSSPVVKAFNEAGLFCSIQGYLQEGEGDNRLQYPMIAVCADIRNFEKIVPIIKAMELDNASN